MKFLSKQWFLVCLVLALAAGGMAPGPLQFVTLLNPFRNAIVFGVMLLTALPLQLGEFRKVLARPQAFAIANLVNLALVPAFCFVGAQFLDPLTAAGLMAVGAAPCTLASAAVWTRRAGGNDALALLVTLSTNLACFATAPLALGLTLGNAVEMPVTELAWRLGTLVVLPVVLAQLLRCVPILATLADRRARVLGTIAQIGLLTIVLTSAQAMGFRIADGQMSLTWSGGILAAAICGAVHILGLSTGYLASTLLLVREPGVWQRDRIAVAIAGSQKTLMVGVLICDDLGFNILPMVFYHGLQLLIDTVVADGLRVQSTCETSPQPESAARRSSSRVAEADTD